MYRHNPDWDWEGMVGSLVVVLAIAVVAIGVTLVVVLVSELVKLGRRHALAPTAAGHAVRVAGGALLGLWLVAGLLALGGLTTAGALLAGWGFLAFVVAAELIDARGARVATPALPDVLAPWWAGDAAGEGERS